MDVTPTPKMYEFFNKLADELIGGKPSPQDMGPGACRVREQREVFMVSMHKLVGLSMREGVGRYLKEQREATERRVVVTRVYS